jgi:hypothetical protein
VITIVKKERSHLSPFPIWDGCDAHCSIMVFSASRLFLYQPQAHQIVFGPASLPEH